MTPKGNILIVGGGWGEARLFRRYGYNIIEKDDLDESIDAIVFTGGADISPSLYGEDPIPETYPSVGRDRMEIPYFHRAQELGIACIGICRGGQLLNVLSGGSLWQDVNHHHRTHLIKDLITGQVLPCSSVHHQMMIPNYNNDALVIAVADESTRYKGQHIEMEVTRGKWQDIEVVYYPSTRSLCFQGHPEFGSGPYVDYFFELLERYIIKKDTV